MGGIVKRELAIHILGIMQFKEYIDIILYYIDNCIVLCYRMVSCTYIGTVSLVTLRVRDYIAIISVLCCMICGIELIITAGGGDVPPLYTEDCIKSDIL